MPNKPTPLPVFHQAWALWRNALSPRYCWNVGLGKAENADVSINGTIKDLFLGTKPPEELQTKGAALDLEQFMSAFALGAHLTSQPK